MAGAYAGADAHSGRRASTAATRGQNPSRSCCAECNIVTVLSVWKLYTPDADPAGCGTGKLCAWSAGPINPLSSQKCPTSRSSIWAMMALLPSGHVLSLPMAALKGFSSVQAASHCHATQLTRLLTYTTFT